MLFVLYCYFYPRSDVIHVTYDAFIRSCFGCVTVLSNKKKIMHNGACSIVVVLSIRVHLSVLHVFCYYCCHYEQRCNISGLTTVQPAVEAFDAEGSTDPELVYSREEYQAACRLQRHLCQEQHHKIDVELHGDCLTSSYTATA